MARPAVAMALSAREKRQHEKVLRGAEGAEQPGNAQREAGLVCAAHLHHRTQSQTAELVANGASVKETRVLGGAEGVLVQ